jgi:hypothetical protein
VSKCDFVPKVVAANADPKAPVDIKTVSDKVFLEVSLNHAAAVEGGTELIWVGLYRKRLPTRCEFTRMS